MMTNHEKLLLKGLKIWGVSFPGALAIMGRLGTEEAVDEMLLYMRDHEDSSPAELYETALKISSKIPEEEEYEVEE